MEGAPPWTRMSAADQAGALELLETVHVSRRPSQSMSRTVLWMAARQEHVLISEPVMVERMPSTEGGEDVAADCLFVVGRLWIVAPDLAAATASNKEECSWQKDAVALLQWWTL